MHIPEWWWYWKGLPLSEWWWKLLRTGNVLMCINTYWKPVKTQLSIFERTLTSRKHAEAVLTSTIIYALSRNMKNIRVFICKFSVFGGEIFYIFELTIFRNERTQLNFSVKFGKYPFYLKCRNGFMTGCFMLKVLVIFNIVPKSVDTCRKPAFVEFELLKTASYSVYGILTAIIDRKECISHFLIQATQQ